jgi:glycosyltransferase involved in cell wall biosynthesis
MSHHLHSCLVSYNRQRLTQETLESYLDTVTIPHSLVIVDNGSAPEVVAWLRSLPVDVVLLNENRYPGFATNRGWEWLTPETTLLQRIDNDVRFLPGWCDEVVEAFTSDETLGQFGLFAEGDEPWTCLPVWPVGGNSIIRRTLYDAGLRYDTRPWSPGWEECPAFSARVAEMGYRKRFGARPQIVYLDDGDDEYRERSHTDRGLVATPWKGEVL